MAKISIFGIDWKISQFVGAQGLRPEYSKHLHNRIRRAYAIRPYNFNPLTRKHQVILACLLLTCSPLLLAWGDTVTVWVVFIKQKKAALQPVEPPSTIVSGANFNERRLAGKSFQWASLGKGVETANLWKRRGAVFGRFAEIWEWLKKRSHLVSRYS